MYTLHKQLHAKIHDVPTPNEDICELIWYELEDLRCVGIINAETDNIEQKLDVLIELLSHCEGNLDVTIATLKWQKIVAHKFYQAPH